MSFSSDVKEELARVRPESDACRTAEAYGLLECAHAFSAAAVSLQTENAAVAAVYCARIMEVCKIPAQAVSDTVRGGGAHFVSVKNPADRTRVLDCFGHSPHDVTLRLNRANLETEAAAAAYLRGAFLACGAVTDPRADYHLEFNVPYYRLSRDIVALIGETGLHPRTVSRKGSYVVYLKESGQIEDCLTMLGATNASLELMSVKMVKDIRNTANRITNCESANIDKTVTAAMAQVEAIRRIERRRGLDSLPEELRTLAALRLENPELSLRELGELLDPPLSRSGVNHRLHRLLELADE